MVGSLGYIFGCVGSYFFVKFFFDVFFELLFLEDILVQVKLVLLGVNDYVWMYEVYVGDDFVGGEVIFVNEVGIN